MFGKTLFTVAIVMLAACAGGEARTPRTESTSPPPPPAPTVSRTSPEDARVGAFVAELNALALGDCSVEYESSGLGDGSGLVVFRGAERHQPPRPPGPPAQIVSHASLRTERYQSPAEVETAVRARQDAFDKCMREHPDDDRIRKGMSMRSEGCRVSFFPYPPTSHYADQFSVVRAEGSGDRFIVPMECKETLAAMESRLTRYSGSN